MAVRFIRAGLLTLLVVLGSSEAKPNYEIEFEAVEIVRDPKFLLQAKIFRVQKFNQTTFVLNVEGNVTEDFPLDTFGTATAYEKMASNKYSKIPVRFYNSNLCDIMKTDMMLYPGLAASSNLPTSDCPVKKGPLWIRNYIPNLDSLPDQLPGGDRWRADFQYTSKNRVIFEVKIFIYVNRHA